MGLFFEDGISLIPKLADVIESWYEVLALFGVTVVYVEEREGRGCLIDSAG